MGADSVMGKVERKLARKVVGYILAIDGVCFDGDRLCTWCCFDGDSVWKARPL
jgi:hypothetical protein